MKRIQNLLLGSAALLVGCDASNHADEIAGLTARVDKLEKEAGRRAAPARAARPARPDPTQTYFVPVHSDDPYRGARQAKVTIVEAYEFACPYCALIEPVLAELLEEYKGTDTLKVVSKQFVVHPQTATEPALATCAAHLQGKFESYASALWDRSWRIESGRPRMNKDELDRKKLVALAEAVGINLTRFEKDLDGQECKSKLQRDRAELARIGVRGTPYLFINGRFYTGGRSASALRKAIEAEVKKADQVLAGGAKVAGYYDRLMKSAKRSL